MRISLMGHYAFLEQKHIARNLKCCTMKFFVLNKDKVSMEYAVTG